ncbi:MmcB family DNA repair protein [Catenibacterium mitsuokai]|uniref:MmcB family DNA repair protein n=1 Tax=Catenibacterium mitsuokai TaxID=100886 RepID=UPI00319E6EA1
MANKIDTIENELESILSSDKKSWVRIYELMDTVEREKLYSDQYSSYTKWVNALADKAKVHVSLLWNRKKAGRVYAAYEERAKACGRTVPAMAAVQVSADNFNLIEKIAGNNTDVADELIDKVLQGDMKRSDLKNAWQTVKADREASGKKIVRVNAYDKGIDVKTETITAADIVLALSRRNWLINNVDTYTDRYTVSKYRVLTEFAVQTGTSHHARRIDALILENRTVEAEKAYNVHIHAVEIKVSKHDLLSDHKMQEYTDYADFFWIAVPVELKDDALSIMLPEWGLITIDDQKELHVIKKAELHDAIFRDQTVETALIKIL